jgi:hypothetical protein
MWTRSRLLLATLVAALALTFAIGGAAASRLRLTSTNFSMRWREFYVPTGIQPEEEPSERANVRRCPLTLSGSFHSATLPKVVNSLVGYVTAAQMGTCTGEGGTVTLLRTGLPWHLTYRQFSGVLPNIASFGLALAGFSMSIEVPPLFGTVCLIRTTTSEPLNIEFRRETRTGVITSVDGAGNQIDARDTTGFLCDGSNPPLAWSMAGTGTLDNGTGTRVTVTLI